ncbi:MAG: hypothetical protein GEU26_04830 [Nitrososphaeraceae archaeon]|nr:hypothetical protein [Nitrososphaeraceae archaeon]
MHHIGMSYPDAPDASKSSKPDDSRPRRPSRQEMREQKIIQNQERLTHSTETLETIKKDIQIPKRIKRLITEANLMLKDENNGSMSVRAANAISIMEELTYSRHVQSHIRTKIWDVVSSLEAIRE